MRRQNFQTISWFRDLHNRDLLNLEPPYQRRSVWNQSYKDYFIDTILLGYPAPALFLYEEIDDNGIAKYNVVDGKQRLISIFEFLDNKYPVYDSAIKTEYRGKYFDELASAVKNSIWGYTFLVEYLQTTDENIINNIFDRINRNMARLTSQELRHARFSGVFLTTCEDLTEWMFKIFDYQSEFPRIAPQSKKQMKDVELVSQLLLIIEDGIPKGYSKDELDVVFSDRDIEWEFEEEVREKFKSIINVLKQIIDNDTQNVIIRSRFKNQADFYSLFSAFYELYTNDEIPEIHLITERLINFLDMIEFEEERNRVRDIETYYNHTQSGINRTTARQERSNILVKVIKEVALA